MSKRRDKSRISPKDRRVKQLEIRNDGEQKQKEARLRRFAEDLRSA